MNNEWAINNETCTLCDVPPPRLLAHDYVQLIVHASFIINTTAITIMLYAVYHHHHHHHHHIIVITYPHGCPYSFTQPSPSLRSARVGWIRQPTIHPTNYPTIQLSIHTSIHTNRPQANLCRCVCILMRARVCASVVVLPPATEAVPPLSLSPISFSMRVCACIDRLHLRIYARSREGANSGRGGERCGHSFNCLLVLDHLDLLISLLPT
eukprot:GHVU01085199.1.p1 GENE.GHVU01085199.1~~GHVU01085199.1.p1  ORF type:complete len:210 (+),score=8.66 GHVU01085199.1:412-1041(+)